MSDRRIQQVSLDYARQYAAPDTLDENDELLVLDNLDRMDFSNKTLQPGFIMYCFCRSGKAGFLLNTQRLEMQAGDLLIGLGEQIFEDCHTSPDFNGVIIIVSRRYSQESIVGLYHLWPYLLYVIDHPVLHLSEEEQRRVGGSYDLLVRRLRHRSHRYRRETIIAQMRTFYFDICVRSASSSKRQSNASSTSRRSYFLMVFLFLIQSIFCFFKKVSVLRPAVIGR